MTPKLQRFLIDLALLVPVTLVILLTIFGQRRRTIGRWRTWMACEGVPIGLLIFVILAVLRTVFLLSME